MHACIRIIKTILNKMHLGLILTASMVIGPFVPSTPRRAMSARGSWEARVPKINGIWGNTVSGRIQLESIDSLTQIAAELVCDDRALMADHQYPPTFTLTAPRSAPCFSSSPHHQKSGG